MWSKKYSMYPNMYNISKYSCVFAGYVRTSVATHRFLPVMALRIVHRCRRGIRVNFVFDISSARKGGIFIKYCSFHKSNANPRYHESCIALQPVNLVRLILNPKLLTQTPVISLISWWIWSYAYRCNIRYLCMHDPESDYIVGSWIAV